MKKSLCILVLVLVGAAVSGSAVAQSCWQYHNFKVDYRSAIDVDPEPYDGCIETKAVGTLNGRYKVCWYEADIRSSESIYGDGWVQVESVKYFSWLETKKGNLDFIEWGWYDGDVGLESGMGKVIGGTGKFEGVTLGIFAWPPRYPALGGIVNYDGYICMPSD